MKRTLILILLAALALTLCACGQEAAEAVTASPAPETAAPPEKPEAAMTETAAPDTETGTAEAADPVVYFTSDISPAGLQAV